VRVEHLRSLQFLNLSSNKISRKFGLVSDLNYFYIFVFAVTARLLLFFLQKGAWYFGDSICYVQPMNGVNPGAGCATHPQVIGWIWKIGSFGNYSELNVILFQSALGIFTALVFYNFLKNSYGSLFAYLPALLWSIFPLELIFERTLMTEAIASSMLIILLWSFERIWSKSSRIPNTFLIFLNVFIAIFGILMKPQWLISGMIVLGLCLYSYFKFTNWGLIKKIFGFTCLALLMFVPVNEVAMLNFHYWGAYTISPASGAYIFARWSPLVSCETSPSFTSITNAAIAYSCGTHFTKVPGYNLQEQIFSKASSPLYQMNNWKYNKSYGTTSRELTALALEGVINHPAIFLQQIFSSISSQLFYNPLYDYWYYNNGFSFCYDASCFQQNWFHQDVPRQYSPVPLFGVLGQWLHRSPQIFFDAAIFASIMTFLYRAANRKLLKDTVLRFDSVTRIISWSFLWSVVLSVALSDFPTFRILLDLVPASLTLITGSLYQIKFLRKTKHEK